MSDKRTIEAEVMDHQFYYEGNAPDLGWTAHDQEANRPDRIIMDEEDRAEELSAEQVSAIRGDAVMRIFNHVLSDFPRTGNVELVGRKVLALAKYSGHKAVDGWSLGQLAVAAGETKAAMSARIHKMCNEPIEKSGGIGQARFQQSPTQRAVSAEAQKGNKNRAGKQKNKEKKQ